MTEKTIDLRPRCQRQRCSKLIRKSASAQADYARYQPFCSYHCQEVWRIESAMAYLRMLPAAAIGEQQ